MRKLFYVGCVVLLVIGVALLAGVAKTVAKTEFTMTAVEPTDGQLLALDKAVFGEGKANWGLVLPRGWGLVQHERQGKVLAHSIKHIVIPKSWLRGSEAARAAGAGGSIYLFGSRIEDQIGDSGKLFRPFFRGLTQAGSVVAGLSLRRMKSVELKAVVRVIGTEIAIITFAE
jgi:hypothetical protein